LHLNSQKKFELAHKAGFINILGNPNAGKSTLINELVGERLAIITPKAQTTRHRMMGIVNGEDYQVVFSDLPGIVKPGYKLHEKMMSYIELALKDADVFLYIQDINDVSVKNVDIYAYLQQTRVPVLILLNKIDEASQDYMEERMAFYQAEFEHAQVMPISALHKFNVKEVMETIVKLLPESDAYFPKDSLTDKPTRFFVTEIIREKIMKSYQKEIPYSVEIVIEDYEEGEDIDKIRANIIVSRESQKAIVIGKGGIKLKHVGIDSRKDIEKFLEKKVYLELYVKVDKNWRDDDRKLKKYGYNL
jgi:GTP-binding protein Era